MLAKYDIKPLEFKQLSDGLYETTISIGNLIVVQFDIIRHDVVFINNSEWGVYSTSLTGDTYFKLYDYISKTISSKKGFHSFEEAKEWINEFYINKMYEIIKNILSDINNIICEKELKYE